MEIPASYVEEASPPRAVVPPQLRLRLRSARRTSRPLERRTAVSGVSLCRSGGGRVQREVIDSLPGRRDLVAVEPLLIGHEIQKSLGRARRKPARVERGTALEVVQARVAGTVDDVRDTVRRARTVGSCGRLRRARAGRRSARRAARAPFRPRRCHGTGRTCTRACARRRSSSARSNAQARLRTRHAARCPRCASASSRQARRSQRRRRHVCSTGPASRGSRTGRRRCPAPSTSWSPSAPATATPAFRNHPKLAFQFARKAAGSSV